MTDGRERFLWLSGLFDTSILRPDFPWRILRDRGQVEAVMNHYGERDAWARIACYFIPNSGPSGRRGFDASTEALNRPEPSFRHSTFFREDGMRTSYRDLWQPFLQRPLALLPDLGEDGRRTGRSLRSSFVQLFLAGCCWRLHRCGGSR